MKDIVDTNGNGHVRWKKEIMKGNIMNKNLFISHSSYDKEVVEVLAGLIKKVSLNQIHIWFSNDQQVEGGFLAGDNWFETILSNLKSSQAVVSLITPNSNNSPWILYESGYAEALGGTKLIPLKFLINVSEVSIPLQRKQIFSFTNVEDANLFLKKVLDAFDIVFDDEVFGDYVLKSLEQMRNCFKRKEDIIKENPYEMLSKKMDTFLEMFVKSTILPQTDIQAEYEVPFEFMNNKGNKIVEYIKINSSIKVSDVLDSLFFILNGMVRAYKYLETWIVKEKGTKRYVVVSDVQNLIYAKDIFRPNTKWEVEFLDKPYSPDNFYNSKNNRAKTGSFQA